MKAVKEQGVAELESFQRRLRRQWAMKKISDETFRALDKKTEELISEVKAIDEEDE